MDEEVAGKLTDHISIGVLTKLFRRDLIDEILMETDRREKRSRLLPSHVVVYFVLALTLFFGEDYDEVMRKLVGGLRFLKNWELRWNIPTTSAMSQARTRLGEAPMKALYQRVAVPIATRGTRGGWYRNWRVMAIDGVTLTIPDTPANNVEYVHVGSGQRRGAFPVVRIVGVAECGSHAIIDATLGAYSKGEQTLAASLLSGLEPDMLLLADRNFYSHDLWSQALRTGAALVWRVTAQLTLPVLERYPDGSYRSVLLDGKTRDRLRGTAHRRGTAFADLPALAEAGTACRVVEYAVDNREDSEEIFCLITSILDWQQAPAHDLAALYNERWEFELSLKEIQTYQLGHAPILRSKLPELVRQEIWALLLTHYAIRHLMNEAADTADIDPDRLSFTRSLRIIRRQIIRQADFPPSAD